MSHQQNPASDLWVFGYGSLMWRPGFDYVERSIGVMHGVRRALCVYSFHHRGTREKPGLVLGLDHGGSCKGVVFRVAAEKRAATLDYLTEREQQNYVYRESYRPVRLADGREVSALVYLMDQRHEQYAKGLSLDDQLRLVRQGQGESGACVDYVRNTVAHLLEMGIKDSALGWIAEHA